MRGSGAGAIAAIGTAEAAGQLTPFTSPFLPNVSRLNDMKHHLAALALIRRRDRAAPVEREMRRSGNGLARI